MYLKVKRLDQKAILPQYAHATDSGMDLHSIENLTIEPGKCKLVRTGLAICLPPFTEAQIRSRSGLAFKKQVMVLNSPGTVDEAYCGEEDEIKVILMNFGDEPFVVYEGDRIAQMVICSVLRPEIVGVKKLNVQDRNRGGFGSTGIGNYDRQIVPDYVVEF